jgi:hypothetical protein
MITVASINEVMDFVTSKGGVEQNFFSSLLITTPNNDRYLSTLVALGYEGEVGNTPDKRGMVSTMANSSDGLMGVVVSYQGERTAVNEVEEEDILN